jgi:hypothetical protein
MIIQMSWEVDPWVLLLFIYSILYLLYFSLGYFMKQEVPEDHPEYDEVLILLYFYVISVLVFTLKTHPIQFFDNVYDLFQHIRSHFSTH